MKLKDAVKRAREVNKKRTYIYVGIAVDKDMDIYAYTVKPKPSPGGQWAGEMFDTEMRVLFLGVYSGNKDWKKTWRKL